MKETCETCCSATEMFKDASGGKFWVKCLKFNRLSMPAELEAKCFTPRKRLVKKTVWVNVFIESVPVCGSMVYGTVHGLEDEANKYHFNLHMGGARLGHRAWPLEIKVEEEG